MVLENGGREFFDFSEGKWRPSERMPCDGRGFDPRTDGQVFHATAPAIAARSLFALTSHRLEAV